MGNIITVLDVLGAGGTVDRTTRRRLVGGTLSDKDLEAMDKRTAQAMIDSKLSKKYEWRPFGGENYGYELGQLAQIALYVNNAVWATTVGGALTVDWRAAAIALGGSIYLQETRYDQKSQVTWKQEDLWGDGSSYCWNVTGGYCTYHYFFRNNKTWLLFLTTWLTLTSDIGGVLNLGKHPVSNYAHGLGFAHGVVLALILERVLGRNSPC